MTITTTLTEIRKHNPCPSGWKKLLSHLGKTQADDEPLDFLTILESNGLDDTLWCLRARPDLQNLWRHFAVDCAARVERLMTDERSRNALTVARKHADGLASNGELVAASLAAWAAERAAARAAAWAAARDKDDAWDAAYAAEQEWQKERLAALLMQGHWSPVVKPSQEAA